MKFKEFMEGSGDVEYSSDYKLSQSGRKVKARRLEFKNGEDDREKNVRNEQAPVAPSLGVHRVAVTTSEPDHPMVSKRKETTQRFVKVTTNSKERAIEQGMKHFKRKGFKVHGAEHVSMVHEEAELEEGYYGGKQRSAAWHADGGANDEGWDDHKPSKQADQPHAVHINGKKWKSFGSQSHAQNVAKKIKGATVHKEEVELHEGAYEKSEENKRSADAAKKQGDMFAHHLHMSDHHENLAQWHSEKGRHSVADSHAEKAEQHHEKAMALKEEVETLEEGPWFKTSYGWAGGSKPGGGKYKHPDTIKAEKEARKKAKEAKPEVKEEAELDEKLNPSMGAGEYIKDFQKSDAPQFKGKSKEKKRMMGIAAYMAAKKGMKEEAEIEEELKGKQHKIDKNKNGKVDAHDFKLLRKEEEEVHSESTVPDHMKGKQKPYVSSDGKGNYEVLGNTGQTKATFSRKEHGANAQTKAREHLKSKYNDYMKEEVQLDEERVNGREYASHGLMHPDHAKMDIHKVSGQHVDFYASKTGDKMQGKVTKNDGKSVHIQAHKELGDGKLHKFKVTPHLPKQQNEGNDMVTYKDFIAQLNEYETDKNGKYVHKGSYGSSYQGDDDEDEDKPKKPAGEKRGRGRPAGSGSGARQKGSGSGKSYGGIATHSLNLPSSK